MMITRTVYENAQKRAANMIKKAGIRILPEEINRIEVVDFGLGNLAKEGVQVYTFVNTGRISAKVLVLFPGQTEPEHWHPPVGNDAGKEETLRVIDGEVYFYISGDNTFRKGFITGGKENYYTCRHELVMNSGDTITLEPGKKHWFQTKDSGAVMYSFSTFVCDMLDKFSDPNILREVEIIDT